MGLPGAGKGTQAQLLADTGWSHINVGGLVRSEVAAGTTWGMRAANFMQRGELVPSQEIQELVAPRLKRCPSPMVIDGYPKRLTEARTLPILCGPRKLLIPIFLKVSRATSIERLARRLICSACGRVTREGKDSICPKCAGPLISRSDDTLNEAVYRRLEAFERKTVPLINYYKRRGELEIIKADRQAGKVHDDIITRVAIRKK